MSASVSWFIFRSASMPSRRFISPLTSLAYTSLSTIFIFTSSSAAASVTMLSA